MANIAFFLAAALSIWLQSVHGAVGNTDATSGEKQIKQHLDELISKIDSLDRTLQSANAGIELLESALKQQQVVIDRLQNRADAMEDHVIESEKTLLVPSNISQLEPLADAGSVYFTACSSDDHQHVYNQGDYINFDTVHHQYPSGVFDTDNGDFHCPVTGTYFFTLSIYFYLLSSEDYRGKVYLYEDSTFLMEVYGQTTGNGYLIVSNSRIHYCEAGSQVYATAGLTSRIYGINHKTSFTGFLLR